MNVLEKTFLHKYLEKFDKVPFSVTTKEGDFFIIGEGEPKFELIFHDSICKSELLKSTSLALGEAYMNKTLEIKGDLYTALDYFLSQIENFTTDTHILKNILHPSNSAKKQKEEIHYHYDIGNDFYNLWLDETMSYSCAYFKNKTDTLYDAQVNKVHHILKKLNLKQGMSVLDIGCGWGFLLIEAAKKYKINGLGITLSEEQAKKFQQRIQQEHLENQLTVKLMDYRNLQKSNLTFDRVVSVGMLEHVGKENYDLFMKNVNSILKKKGVCLLHYISALKEHPGDAWIKKYIFPGGMIPSLREIVNLCAEYNFHIIDIESLRRHYNQTLLCWNNNFQQHKKEITQMFDEKFVRMWELYLCSCAASFHNGAVDVHQIILTKGINNDLPMTRAYMYNQ